MLQCTNKARLCSVDHGIVPIRSIHVWRDQLSTHKARLCSADHGFVPIRSVCVWRDQLSMMLTHTEERGDSLNYWLWERMSSALRVGVCTEKTFWCLKSLQLHFPPHTAENIFLGRLARRYFQWRQPRRSRRHERAMVK